MTLRVCVSFLEHTAKVPGYSQCLTAMQHTVVCPFSFEVRTDSSSMDNLHLSSPSVYSFVVFFASQIRVSSPLSIYVSSRGGCLDKWVPGFIYACLLLLAHRVISVSCPTHSTASLEVVNHGITSSPIEGGSHYGEVVISVMHYGIS